MTSVDGWKESTLGDYFRIKHGYAFKGEFFADSGQYVLLTPGNFQAQGGLQERGEREKFYRGEFPPEFLLKIRDMLVVMTDLTQNAPILGSPAIIEVADRFLHNQRLGKVVNLDEARMNQSFLYHLFNSPDVRAQIRGSATGSTVRHTAPDRIYAVRVRVPPLPVQRCIASILSAYDDLIENNTRRIKILEQMAEMIYREWFVNFRFPGHKKVPMVESEFGPIPDGWTIEPLEALVEEFIDYRGKTPKKLGADWSESGILALSALNVKQGRLVNLDKAKLVSEGLYRRWMKSELRAGDILMTSEAPLGELYFLPETRRYCLSQRVFSIRSRTAVMQPSLLFLALSSPEGQKQLKARASGTTVSGIRQADLRRIPILRPPAPLQQNGDTTLRPFLLLIDVLRRKTDTLRTTRDFLLPKLISGELSVETADETAAELMEYADQPA